MSLPEHILVHPTLGCSLRGKPSSTSIQFRNIKYASIPARYQDSKLRDTLNMGTDGVFDATRFGPSCPHKRGAQAWDLTLLGNVSLPCEQGPADTEEMDEFECLHVNVTVPKSVLQGRERDLPVFVWVHGGGLSMGSNNWPQYDLQKFVNRSVELAKPVIAVAINYRIGLLGFLASEDIGALGNMGYKDQVLAFRWIKQHIAGFGGDPGKITAAGESAGGISLSTLLCANIATDGLFEQVIIMSGDATLRKSRTKWWQTQLLNDQALALKVKANDPQSLAEKLLNTDAEDLAQQLPLAAHYCGYVDGKWLKQDANISLLANENRTEHKPNWCKTFVIGDTAHDGTVLKARILDHPQVLDGLKHACSKYLTKAETIRLLAAYNLDRDLSPEQEREAVLQLASELRFYDPARRIHNGWKGASPAKNTSRYHFHVANPFEGAFKGLASHELDVAFLLQNFNDQLDAKHRYVAQGMAEHFIKFVNGHPWASQDKLVVFGSEGVIEVNESEYDRLYRQGRGDVLSSIDYEKLWRVAEMWQGVRSEDEESRYAWKL
ncbi:Alpha/Beta hydrolase protein [Ampelomyces quisqualis]|uniref:Alpha/Beta hydrolase protein n=1 Tax=Ampelomyces quisqualis TaxID=50730 RepID=A0A6A5QAH1_AMPQU|nr:Alpha/Beta hydrolase protein [Ampelomyces quisqualis]